MLNQKHNLQGTEERISRLKNSQFPKAFRPFPGLVKQPRDIAHERTAKNERQRAKEVERTNSVVVSFQEYPWTLQRDLIIKVIAIQ